jgi:hypothetical protein
LLLLYFISLLSAGLMKLKVDVIVNPVLFEEEDTGLVELAIALEDEVVYIFNPRQQRWNTNCVWNGVEAETFYFIVSISPRLTPSLYSKKSPDKIRASNE